MTTQQSRVDGRRVDELRSVHMETGYISTAPGSVLIRMGETHVICTVSVEERVPPFLAGSGKGWLTAEYGMLPGSSPRRIARESTTGKPNGRTREIQRLIGRSLRAAVDLQRVGERTLYVDCDVIQADGGTRTASITGAYVALNLACERLQQDGLLSETPLIEQPLAAVSVGIVDGVEMLDLCYTEDSVADTDMNVVMLAGGGIIEIQATAEAAPFDRRQTDRLLDLAQAGIASLHACQSKALKSGK